MPSEPIYVNQKLFLGRVEEQKQFRAALNEALAAPPGEELPYIFLLYGDGGMGKTTLARRFRDIAQTEQPFAGEFQALWVDWEDERLRSPRLQVGREYIRPEDVFDILHQKAIQAGWGREFEAYQNAVKMRAEADKKAAAALEPSGERDEFAELRRAGASTIAKILRLGLPIGETGEKVAQAFLEAGIQVGAEKGAQLRAALETRLRARLNPEQFALFLNPNEQLARALAEGLKRVAKRKPLLLFLDTYEIVDRADLWLREVMRAAGPRIVWIISGRHDLARSRPFGGEYFRGYAEEFPRRLVARDLLQLAQQDLRQIFANTAPDRPLDAQAVEALIRATRGIPLAIEQAAEMWKRGVALADIVGEIDEATPRGEIVQKMTARYFLHAPEADKPLLYALALARGDIEILRAMLRPADGSPFDLEALLRRLERDYASVHAERARLYDDPAFFFREHLRAKLRRMGDERVRTFLQRAVETLRARLEQIQADLPRLEDRCESEDWTKAALDLCDYLFWLDEREAWRWLAPRLVESLAYSRELRRGLLNIASGWKEHLSADGKKRLKRLSAAQEDESPEAQADLLDELTRLERLGYLQGWGEAERGAILDWRRGQLAYARRQYPEALAAYERAERALPEGCEALKKLLGEALYELSNQFIWPAGATSSIPTQQGLRASELAVTLDPTNGSALYNHACALQDLGEKEKALEFYQRSIAVEERATRYNGLGNVYDDLGNYDDAIAAYQRAIQLDPKVAAPHNGLGNVYYALGNYDEALAAYQRAIQLDPKDAYPHHGLGNVYRALGNYDDAIAAYQRAIQLDPKDAYPHNGLGNVYSDLGNYDEAIAAYQRAIQLDPKDAHPHHGLGNVYYQLGKYDDAIAAYQRAIQLDPKVAAPHNGLGNVYYQLGKYDDAIAAYQRAIQLDPKYAAPHNGLGNVYYQLGKYDDAIAAYQRAIQLDPKVAAPHHGLGNVYSDLGKYDDAIAAYQRAIALDPKYAAPHNGLGSVYRALGNYDDAIAAYQRAIQLDPKDAYPHNGLGNVYSDLGKYDDAIAAYQRAIALDPKYAYPHHGLGNVYSELGKYDDAIAAYQRAIQLDPKDAAPHHGLGNVYSDLGNYDEAIAAYQRAIQLDPKLAAPHHGLGNVYRALGNYDEALAAYQRAIQLDPKDAYPHNGLGNVYRALGNYDEAIAAYQRAIQLDPKVAAPHHGLGIVYRALGNYDDAIAAYQRAIQLDPKYAAPHNGLGNVYSDLGNYGEAIAAYQRAIQLDPKFAAPHNGLGNVYSDLGNYGEAIAAYQRAIQLDPKFAYPHNNLADVFVKLGRFDEARREYNERIRLAPENPFTPLVALGVIARHQGLPESDEHFQRALEHWEAAWRARWQTPAGLLKNKAKALLCLGRKEEALQTLAQSIAQMQPGEPIELDDWELLHTAPAPPAGVEEAIAMLKEAQARRK